MEYFLAIKKEWNNTICNNMDGKWKWNSPSHVQFFATPWTKQPMEFFRPEYWSG